MVLFFWFERAGKWSACFFSLIPEIVVLRSLDETKFAVLLQKQLLLIVKKTGGLRGFRQLELFRINLSVL